MCRNLALIEDDAPLRIDAGGKISRGDLARVCAQFGGVLPYGDGMQVDDAVDAIVVVLQRDEVSDRPEIVSQVQVTGRLNAGEYPFHFLALIVAL